MSNLNGGPYKINRQLLYEFTRGSSSTTTTATTNREPNQDIITDKSDHQTIGGSIRYPNHPTTYPPQSINISSHTSLSPHHTVFLAPHFKHAIPRFLIPPTATTSVCSITTATTSMSPTTTTTTMSAFPSPLTTAQVLPTATMNALYNRSNTSSNKDSNLAYVFVNGIWLRFSCSRPFPILKLYPGYLLRKLDTASSMSPPFTSTHSWPCPPPSLLSSSSFIPPDCFGNVRLQPQLLYVLSSPLPTVARAWADWWGAGSS